MLKIRIIPILTFNGLALVKTKQFGNPRMLGNPIQIAKVFNSRNVDELIFIDIFATKQKRKINLQLVKGIIKQCYMPVGIGGGINSLDDIRALLNCGADKVLIKHMAIENPDFVEEAANKFGSQCISISVDVIKKDDSYFIHHEGENEIPLLDFIQKMENKSAGELIVNSVNNDGMMKGFDTKLYSFVHEQSSLPVVAVGGGGKPKHYQELFSKTELEAVGSSSIFAYTQYTPNDIKRALRDIDKPVRYFEPK